VIELTRLNRQTLVVNSDLIKFIERSPDTVITLTTGEKLVVRETLNDVIRRVVEFRRAIAQGYPPRQLHGEPVVEKG